MKKESGSALLASPFLFILPAVTLFFFFLVCVCVCVCVCAALPACCPSSWGYRNKTIR